MSDEGSELVEVSATKPSAAEVRQRRAVEMAEGLRSLAAMLEENPDLVDDAAYLSRVDVFYADDPERLAAVARTALRYGATVKKEISAQQHNVRMSWGPLGVMALAARETVCERVVTGTETVTKTVPDPAKLAAVPLVEVTETVERVEWRCSPLLAAESASVKAGV